MSEHLARAKDQADWAFGDGPCSAGSPDERTVPYLLAGILDALIAIAERMDAPHVEPGLCWHDSGIVWPNSTSPRCELRAGHAGAHECDRGGMGGTAVWTDHPTPTPSTAPGRDEEQS